MKANFDAETELVMKVLVSYVLQVAVCVELRLQLKTDIVLQCCSEICNLMRNIYVHAHCKQVYDEALYAYVSPNSFQFLVMIWEIIVIMDGSCAFMCVSIIPPLAPSVMCVRGP